MTNPATTQKRKAEMFALQSSFWMIIGIMSINPANNRSRTPVTGYSWINPLG
jgi:hypothetical protein